MGLSTQILNNTLPNNITTIAQMTHLEEGDFEDENWRESLLQQERLHRPKGFRLSPDSRWRCQPGLMSFVVLKFQIAEFGYVAADYSDEFV